MTDAKLSAGAVPWSDTAAGTLSTLVAALGFGAVSTFTQVAMDRGASLWGVLLWRFVIGAGVMLATVAVRQYPRLARQDVIRWTVLGGGGQALLLGLALSSLRYITAGTLAFLFYTYPVWVALIQTARGAERLSASRWAALACSFGGTVIVAGTPLSEGLAWPGVGLALGAAVVYGFYIPMMQWMQRDLPVPQTSAYAKMGSAVCFLIMGLASGTPMIPAQPSAWAAITGLAILSTVLPTLFFMWGLLRLGPVRTSIVSTVEPFLTAILGAVVLRQPLSGHTVLGGALIVTAVILLRTSRPGPAA